MHEIAWFESFCGSIIATIVLDTDGEFSAQLLAPDRLERFRWIATTELRSTPEEVVTDLHDTIERLLPELDQHRDQGDEVGQPVDFFKPVVAEDKLHPNFRRIADEREFTAARKIISVMMRWHEDIDGNFIEQFQTTAFDARLWELYLFAMMIESNLTVLHPKPAPDFLASGLIGEFAMEATTINPSVGADGHPQRPPNPTTPEEEKDYEKNYLPIRYAGPLTTKLGKRYWERDAASNKPLVFAIQDFHAPMSMIHSGHALSIYLYGLDYEARFDDGGELAIHPIEITEHRWGTKTVASGFFSLPDAQHVSAVLFNSAGTVAKFNRMGTAVGFGTDDVVLIRRGRSWDTDPNSTTPFPFIHFVTEGYPESWAEGMDVYHNPNAIHPLDHHFLPMAAHHRLTADRQIETTNATAWKPIGSMTSVIVLPPRSQKT